ncbi:uncharacterized protein LOC118882542 isoform X2 [Balaenoptera musculus]|uniref:Uncharacterized protein LOC118882542 isoform X2 n=1 Tax=Balaenoptera musculus TaxID=9771 RepID=A0A8B8VIG8_BALMU|nr:uncharacterized protein LOC118882542 isoform X2 [Balaenoptera musculus]
MEAIFKALPPAGRISKDESADRRLICISKGPLRGQPCAGSSARPADPGENSPRQAARSPPSAVLGPKRTLQWDTQAGNTWQHAALSPARQLVRSDGAAAMDGAGPSCPDTRFGPRTQEPKLTDQVSGKGNLGRHLEMQRDGFRNLGIHSR